jgi:hypothetical protein
MKPQKLELGMLKFMKSSSNTYDFVELKSQLLHIFPEEREMKERLKMSRFLKFLTSGDFIEISSKRGINIITEAGKPVKRNEISVIAKLTPRGVELLHKEKNSSYNKFGIISAFLMSLFSLGYGYFQSEKSSQLEVEIISLSKSIDNMNIKLDEQRDSLTNFRINNTKLQADIKRIESQLKTGK